MNDTLSPPKESRSRLIAIDLDRASITKTNPNIEHEREVAIFDILDGNSFELDGQDLGPYKLTISTAEDRLLLAVADEADAPLATHAVSMAPFKRLLKDYFMVCDSYYQAIRSAPPSKIQAIDMGRRGLHDEGSRLLQERLGGKINVDFDTARRLFTLITALHWKG
jgi:uncharacterized protein (UPF0262 family)